MKVYGGSVYDYTIGITADVDARLRQHSGKTRILNSLSWLAFSEQDARDTEAYLLKLYPDVKGDTGGGNNPKYVYIFKS